MSARVLVAIQSFLLIAALAAPPTLATSVTPAKLNKWRQDQVVPFVWKADAKPPAWLRPAIVAATEDSNASRDARAGAFALDETAASWISYSDDVCTDSYIGCTTNNAPNSFYLRLRLQGWVFDWGTLRWCQFYETPPDGCYDAEMITLHELGHAQGLGHIEDAADPGDWLDSVMHRVSRAKPKPGWDAHQFGRCDVAALQAAYQPLTSSTAISTCLSLRTTAALSASPTTVAYRGSVRFTASLATSDDLTQARLRGLPLSDRTLTLERRLPGGAWYAYSQLPPSSTVGQYTLTITATTTYDWRVTFATPAGEGLLGANSPAVRVTVGECTSGCTNGGGVM